MEKILVTGGAGFIGSHLVPRLLADGHKVTVFDNLSTGRMENLAGCRDDIEFIPGDIRDDEDVASVVCAKDTIYHLAAAVGVDKVLKAGDDEVKSINMDGTMKILNHALHSEVKKFFFASSSEVYGKVDPSKMPLKEDMEFVPDTVYGQTKLFGEQAGKRYSYLNGMSVVSARFFNIYGPNQSNNGYCVPGFIKRAIRNEPLVIHGDGEQTRDLTYVDDAVNFIVSLCDEKMNREVYNLGKGKAVTMNELAMEVLRVARSSSDVKYIPLRRATDAHHKCSDPSKILRDTGQSFQTPLAIGLEETIESYRREL